MRQDTVKIFRPQSAQLTKLKKIMSMIWGKKYHNAKVSGNRI